MIYIITPSQMKELGKTLIFLSFPQKVNSLNTRVFLLLTKKRATFKKQLLKILNQNVSNPINSKLPKHNSISLFKNTPLTI